MYNSRQTGRGQSKNAGVLLASFLLATLAGCATIDTIYVSSQRFPARDGSEPVQVFFAPPTDLQYTLVAKLEYRSPYADTSFAQIRRLMSVKARDLGGNGLVIYSREHLKSYGMAFDYDGKPGRRPPNQKSKMLFVQADVILLNSNSNSNSNGEK